MRRLMDRIRAAASPPVWAAAAIAAALFLYGMSGTEQTLEKRTADVLSKMEGAGRVRVVIRTRESENRDEGMLGTGERRQPIPVGAVAVAEGAADPYVRMEMTGALCALLGLPPTAVEVIEGK